MIFIGSFLKTAVIDMASDAALLANAPMQTFVPGSGLEKDTAQGRGETRRTLTENKNIPRSKMRLWENARNMGIKEN